VSLQFIQANDKPSFILTSRISYTLRRADTFYSRRSNPRGWFFRRHPPPLGRRALDGEVAALLRTHVAPILSHDPDTVTIRQVVWGDLGAHLVEGGRFRSPRMMQREPVRFKGLAKNELGQTLERELLRALPNPSFWPTLVEAAWVVARDEDQPR
jgi:hypothetical protein